MLSLNIKSKLQSLLWILLLGFLLGYSEGVLIFEDRLLGLGGWHWFSMNLGMIYLLVFSFIPAVVLLLVSAENQWRVVYAFGGIVTVVLAARVYRIHYGKLVDEVIYTFLILILLSAIIPAFVSFLRSNSWRYLMIVPFMIFILGFIYGIESKDPSPSMKITQPEQNPPIVWITADTLRTDHLSQYGYERDVFEQFDRWKKDFAQFQEVYSTSSWTAPSVASMLTSLYPLQHGKSRGSLMNQNIATVPQILRRVGYKNYAISNQPLVSPGWGFGKGFDRFYSTSTIFTESTLIDILNDFVLEENMVAYTSSMNWFFPRYQPTEQSPAGMLDTYHSVMKSNPDDPFFLYLYFFDPHSPYNPDPKWYPKGTESLEETRYFNDKEALKPEGQPSDTVLREITRRYDGEINDVGDKVDRILSDLKERGYYEDSLIIFTSDHGEKFYDHGSWLHGGKLYQEVTRVPLFVKFPDEKLGGSVIERPIDQVNMMPTLLNNLGVNVQLDYSFPGRPIFKGEEVNSNLAPPVMARIDWNDPSQFHLSTVQEGKKFLYHAGMGEVSVEGYNLTGPLKMEWQSLGTVSENTRNTLETLSEHHQSFDYAPRSTGQSQREKLKGLGYIE